MTCLKCTLFGTLRNVGHCHHDLILGDWELSGIGNKVQSKQSSSHSLGYRVVEMGAKEGRGERREERREKREE